MSFATLTHARIRAAQGDVRGARRIVRSILERRPDDAEAQELLAALDPASQRASPVEREEPVEAPRPAAPSELAARFRQALGSAGGGAGGDRRVRRLRRWLERIERPARGLFRRDAGW